MAMLTPADWRTIADDLIRADVASRTRNKDAALAGTVLAVARHIGCDVDPVYFAIGEARDEASIAVDPATDPSGAAWRDCAAAQLGTDLAFIASEYATPGPFASSLA